MVRFGWVAVLLPLTGLLLPAVTEPIGVAISPGQIRLDNVLLPGNATVFEGSTLGSVGQTSTQVRLKSGASVRLSLSSSGKVYRDHVDLIVGMAEISGYSANANGLKIQAEGSSSAEIAMQGKTIQVASLSGDVHVFNAQGINVANLVPGRTLSFLPEPQDAGASAPSSLVGCVVKTGNNFFVTDETSNVTAQLRGNNLRAGRRLQITGTVVPNAAVTSPASQVINVTGVKEAGGTCKAGLVAGTAAGAAAGAAAAGAAGVAAATVGVAVGATAAVTSAVVAGVTTTNVSTTAAGAGSTVIYQDTAGNTYTVTTFQNGTQTITVTPPNSTGPPQPISSLPSSGLTCISACTGK